MFINLRLTGKLVLSIVVLFFLGAAALTFITNSLLLANLNKATEKEARAVAQRCANEVKSAFSLAKTQSETLAAVVRAYSINGHYDRDGLSNLMVSIMEEDINLFGLWLEFEKNMFGNDRSFLKSNHSLASNGRFCPYVEKTGDNVTLLADAYSDEEVDSYYYSKAKISRETWFASAENYEINGVDRQMITVFTPIYINDEFKGVSGVDILVDSLLLFFKEMQYFDSGHFIVVDENMNVVFSPKKDMISQDFKKIAPPEIIKAMQQVAYTKDIQHTNVNSLITGLMSRATVIPLSFTDYKKDWLLLLYAPLSEVYSARNKTILINSVIFIILVITVFYSLSRFIKRMVRPISELATISERLSKGDVNLGDVNLDTYSKYNDEIGDLTRAFSTVIEGIKEQSSVMSKVASGDYSHHVKERSDYDILSKNINIMIDSQKVMLKRMSESVLESNKAKELAEMANRSKSDFLSNMSHEIRTPLNAVSGMTELIIRDTVSEQVLNNAYHIRNACASLLTIINDILDFSKIEAGKLDVLNTKYQLQSIIHDVTNIVNIRLDNGNVDFIVNMDEYIPYELLGDEIRIRQVLLNLLGNAVKFTHKGSITLKVWHEGRENNKTNLWFSVIDTGVGIKKEDICKLFSSFSQVDTKKNRNVEGTGLGLAISKRLIELMQGEINVVSEYGIGSTFSFYVEQSISDMKPIGKYEKIDYKDNSNQLVFKLKFTAPDAKVLIVDDNIVNLLVAEGLMLPYKVDVTTASSGKECMELIKSNSYDLIFMDHMMPEMDGVEAMKLIKQSGIGNYDIVPVVALTANAISGASAMYINEGFNDFLAKPIEVNKLDAILNKYLNKKSKKGS